MLRKTSLANKIPAAVVLLVMLFNFLASPIYSVASEITAHSGTDPTWQSVTGSDQVVGEDDPTLGEITIPTVTKNPYRPTVHKLLYPVMRSDIVNYSDSMFHTLQSSGRSDEHSKYFTLSLSALLGYYYAGGYAGGYITQNNPIPNMRKNTLNPDVYAYARKLGFTVNSEDVNDYMNFICGSYVYDYLHLNKEHLSFEITAKQVNANHVKMDVGVRKTNGKSFTYYEEMTRDGERAVIEVPLKDVVALSGSVDGYCYGGSAFTDVMAILTDDTSPSVTDITVSQEMTENDNADLVMKLTFNEGIRFADLREGASLNYLDSMWIDVEIEELETGKLRTVKLYVSDVGADCTMTLRADIGRFHYYKYRVNRITDVGFDENVSINNYTATAIDLTADPEDGPDAALYSYKEATGTVYRGYFRGNITPITDIAGNSLVLDSIVDWSFGEQFNDPSFGIEEIGIYNDNTLSLAEGTFDPKDLASEDLFIGTNTNMTVKVYLSRILTQDQWKKVSIKLNLIGPGGDPIVLTPTGVTEYSRNYLYDNGTLKGTVLLFENVVLPKGTKPDVPIGGDPVIKVTELINKITEFNFYPYFDNPIVDMRVDFTSPTVSARILDDRSSDQDGGEYNTSVIELVLSDVADYGKIAGLVGGEVAVSLGAEVEGDVSFRYLLSDSAVPPESKDGYTGVGTLTKNGYASVGNIKIINDPEKLYLHTWIDQESIYVGDLKLNVQLTDAIGNLNSQEEIPITLDYVVDKIAPDVKIISKEATASEENTKMILSVSVLASDPSTVSRMEYYIGDEPDSDGASWTPIVKVEEGTDVTGNFTREYGGLSSADNKIVNELLWVRAHDLYGNVSEPVSAYINLSLEKPATNARLMTDGADVRTDHNLLVTGPEASSFDGADAYTRVTITPRTVESFAYVVLVKTGESVNIFDFENVKYYKVKTNIETYAEVIGEFGYTRGELLDDHPLRELLTYYGELKISFENGYGDMTPRVGYGVHEAANDGSYYKDPNYVTVRFASPYDTERSVHSVAFGKVVSRTDEVLTESLNEAAAPIVIGQSEIGFGAMRNMQIHFSVVNSAKSDFGYLDLDYERSYAEFFLLGEGGGEDILMSRADGLAASGNQYFTVGNTDDYGNLYRTGAYYLKVTVRSRSGHEDVFRSGLIVLDAETADTAGVWEYSYHSPSNIYYVNNPDSYSAIVKRRDPATEKYFTEFGISVMAGGETMRSRVFAAYSYGASSLTVDLSAPNATRTVGGVPVGRVEGYKLWNILSAPTGAEIEAAEFVLNYRGDSLSLYNNLSDIYDKDTIPKGMDGIGVLHLVKGVNVFCYQTKLENGYVTPIRYFTVTVTDKAPTLNIAIDDYIPSHEPSSVSGVVNIDSIKMFVETAYSFNGSGKVDVQLWSKYAMNLGLYGEDGELRESYVDVDENDEGVIGILTVLKAGLREGEYAVITENSYTSDFPEYNTLCTAAFVAVDEYGGTTIIAPQIGNAKRHGVYGGVPSENEYDISYDGDYYNDPYVLGDNGISWRVRYNEPSYNGNILLGFESYLLYNDGENETRVKEISKDDGGLGRNLFNISSNDIYPTYPSINITSDGRGVSVNMGKVINADLITQLSTITLSGDGIDGEVTIPLFGANSDYGYSGAEISYYFETYGLDFRFANPKADADNPQGTVLKRKYRLNLDNGYGEVFSTPEYYVISGVEDNPYFAGDFELQYMDYSISGIEMTESGALLTPNFFVSGDSDDIRTGKFNPNPLPGSNGMYTVTVKDYYGNDVVLEYTVDSSIVEDHISNVEITNPNTTAKPVTVTISSEAINIFVDIVDYDIMSVENNGTSSVTVTLNSNARFSYRYLDSNGDERVYYVDVDNIINPNVGITFDPDPSEPATDPVTGEKFVYGEVKAYVTDESFMIIDSVTGLPPIFTFTPGGPMSYTYPAGTLVARLGEGESAEEIALGEITISLKYPLRELPEVNLGSDDDIAPGIQVLAYSMQGGEWSDEKLAMQLTSRRGIFPFTSYDGYTVYAFSGERANMTKVLNDMGWSTSYRFLFEISDSSRVRMFVKEGLYAEAPSFENGISDVIKGVELNSKLLTVNGAAKFTVFAIDSKGNVSSVAFDINNVGEAPAPTVKRIPTDNGVRIYLIKPDGAEELEILSVGMNIGIENAEGEFKGLPYVDVEENDTYEILYKMKYNGTEISPATIEVSVSELRPDEIVLSGGITWSANKLSEATASDVIAKLLFSDDVVRMDALSEYDGERVSFTKAGPVITVTYKENSAPIKLKCYAENGSFVTVELDSVTNIDRNAPVISCEKIELAKDRKSATITIKANERVTFKEGGGFVGELIDGAYYYTRVVTSNGDYTYTFTDMSGISASITVTVDTLVLEPLTVEFSKNSDGRDAVNDPALLEVTVGETVFVKPSRDATMKLSMGFEITADSDKFTPIAIPEAFGGISPYITFTDPYGNVYVGQFSSVVPLDTSPPELAIDKELWTVREGTERETIIKELYSNVAAFDDSGETLTVGIEIPDGILSIGIYSVRYYATDSSGNTSEIYGRLRITSIYDPVVYLGNTKVDRDDGIYLGADDEITVSVNSAGVEFDLYLSAGRKTAAQLKGNKPIVEDSKGGDILLGKLAPGIYTVMIVTEEREYFTFLISVTADEPGTKKE